MTQTTLETFIFVVVTVLTIVVLLVGKKLQLRWLTYEGRFRRKIFIPLFFISAVMTGFSYIAIFDSLASSNIQALFVMTVSIVIFLAVLVASSMKRLQDIGYSGWYYVIYLIVFSIFSNFIPQINVIGYAVAAFLMVWRGQPGKNQFGEDPREKPEALIKKD